MVHDDNTLLKKIEETVAKGLGGLGMEEFIRRLKEERGHHDNEANPK